MYRTNSKKKLKKFRKDSLSSSDQSFKNYKRDDKKVYNEISKLTTEEIVIYKRKKQMMESFESWQFGQWVTDKIINRSTCMFYSRKIDSKVHPHNAGFLNELIYSIFLLSNINYDKGENFSNFEKFKHLLKPSAIAVFVK